MGKKGKPLFFKGSTFHRVIPQFMLQVNSPTPLCPVAFASPARRPIFDSLFQLGNVIQGGDFTDGVGTGGESIYGDKFQVRASYTACN